MQRGWGASGGGGTEPGGSGRRACLGAAGSLPAWVLQLSFDLRGSHPPETWGGWGGLGRARRRWCCCTPHTPVRSEGRLRALFSRRSESSSGQARQDVLKDGEPRRHQGEWAVVQGPLLGSSVGGGTRTRPERSPCYGVHPRAARCVTGQ